MTLENLYFLAQIIAAVAVVGSLIFVGIQLRETALEQRLRRQREVFDIKNTLVDTMSTSPELARVFWKANFDFESLTLPELALYSNQSVKTMHAYDLLKRMEAQHAIQSEDVVGLEETIYSILSTPGGQIWWGLPAARRYISPALRTRVQELLDTGAARGMKPLAAPNERRGVIPVDEASHDA